jgi:hypothetical protein
MIRLINVCCDDVEAKRLPTVDLEWLFLQIRIKSVGETSDITMKCDECETENSLTVDLEAAEVKQEETFSNVVNLTDDISVELQYANYESMDGLDLTAEEVNTKEAFILMNRCVTAVIQGDEIHTRDDFTDKELERFIDSMSVDMLEGVQNYLGSAPTLSIVTEFKCSSCDKQQRTVLEGIANFFG